MDLHFWFPPVQIYRNIWTPWIIYFNFAEIFGPRGVGVTGASQALALVDFQNFIAKTINLHEYFTTIYCTRYLLKLCCIRACIVLKCFSSERDAEMAKKFDSSSHKLVDISDKAHQPKSLVFPKRKCGIKDRCFQRDWFEKWSWLHYNELNDVAYCFTCTKVIKEKKVKTGNIDACFVSSGFTNWKDATWAFKRHEVSDAHKAAVDAIVTILKITKDIGTALSEGYKREVETNCQMLLKIISIVLFLCRQGLPLRGHGDDSDSNFMQALKFQNEADTAAISSWIEKKRDKFTSPQIQNEIIKSMSLRVLRNIITSIQSVPFFTIMIDETTDCTNKEQAVVVIRWVDDSLSVHEEFIGLHEVENIKANTLVRVNLSVHKIRGPCYDGSSNMSGLRNGVRGKSIVYPLLWAYT